jgi:hypothetical protein
MPWTFGAVFGTEVSVLSTSWWAQARSIWTGPELLAVYDFGENVESTGMGIYCTSRDGYGETCS